MLVERALDLVDGERRLRVEQAPERRLIGYGEFRIDPECSIISPSQRISAIEVRTSDAGTAQLFR